ncbi:MAG TPA: MFS transporter [Bacteroidota bacterium]
MKAGTCAILCFSHIFLLSFFSVPQATVINHKIVNPWRGIGSLPREVWVLFATNLINRMGMMGLPFLVIYLTSARGFSPSDAGLVLSVYGLSALVTSPFAGRLSDTVGPVLVMKLSLFFSGIVLILFPFASSFRMIVAGTVLWAVTGEAFRPASLAVITSVVSSERRRSAFSVNRLAINLGMSIGPAFGGFLLMYSYPLIFWVDGATSLMAAILVTVAMKTRLTPQHQANSPREAESKMQGISMFKDRRLVFFLLTVLPVFITFFQHSSTVPLVFFEVLHQPASAFGFLFTFNTVLIVLVEIPLNLAMSRWSHRNVLALGALLVGAGFGAMTFATGFWSVAATVVIWTFGEMIFLPGAAAYVGDIASARRQGSYMGVYQMAANASFAIGPWLGATIFQHFGPATLWTGLFIACGISSLVFLRVHEEPHRDRAGQASTDH